MDDATHVEALRQQWLLAALRRPDPDHDGALWLSDAPARRVRGLSAYQSNAGAVAERALASAYPVVVQMLGEEAFAHLARALWQADPPQRGDLGHFGAGLAAFVSASDQLADEPYMADLARLEWAVHRAAFASDTTDAVNGLELLATHDPAQLGLVFRPGTAVVMSTHPIVSIWAAHQWPEGDERQQAFVELRALMAQGRGEAALVCRRGWRVEAAALPAGQAHLTAALLASRSIADALDESGADLEFEPWLVNAVRAGWLSEVVALGAGFHTN